MKQMDDKYRDPLDLRMMGYSIQEIAEILEITPQNAKVRLHRARQMILKEMRHKMNQQENREIRISPDALIALVVAEAEDRELSAMPSLEEMNAAFHPSEEFQKKMDRLLKQAKRKQERKGAWRATKRLFVVATTVVTAFACILMPVQAVQEAVVSTVLNWRDQFVEILYSKEDDPNAVILLQNVELTYLPEGFTETPSNRTSNTSFWNEYQSENGEWLTVRILPIQDKQSTFVDDEYTHYYQISFDGIDAVLGSTIDGSNVLVWQNDGLTYQVSSSCDLSEIISVAEGIKLDSSSNG